MDGLFLWSSFRAFPGVHCELSQRPEHDFQQWNSIMLTCHINSESADLYFPTTSVISGRAVSGKASNSNSDEKMTPSDASVLRRKTEKGGLKRNSFRQCPDVKGFSPHQRSTCRSLRLLQKILHKSPQIIMLLPLVSINMHINLWAHLATIDRDNTTSLRRVEFNKDLRFAHCLLAQTLKSCGKISGDNLTNAISLYNSIKQGSESLPCFILCSLSVSIYSRCEIFPLVKMCSLVRQKNCDGIRS